MKKLFAPFIILALSAPAMAGGFSGDGFGTRGFFQYKAGAAAPATGMSTPILADFIGPTTGTSNYFVPIMGSVNVGTIATAATNRFTPIPIAGKIKNLYASLGLAQNLASINLRIGTVGTNGTVGCSFAAGRNCSDTTNNDPIAAGTVVQWSLLSGGATWTAPPNNLAISFVFQSDVAQQSMLLSSAGNTSIAGSAVTQYLGFGYAFVGTSVANTESNVSSMLPAAGQITGMYVYPNGNDSATNPHVYNVIKNGNTGSPVMSCTGATSPVTGGCCVNVGGVGTINGAVSCTNTATFSVVAGDTLSVQASCPSAACGGITPAVGLIWVPAVANQALLLSQNYSGSFTANRYLSPSDGGSVTTQNCYQVAPINMTISNLLTCTAAGITTGSWTVNTQKGADMDTLPVNISGGPAVTFGAANTCPGAMSGTFPKGVQDTSSASITAGSSLDYFVTNVGGPQTSALWRLGMTATVP